MRRSAIHTHREAAQPYAFPTDASRHLCATSQDTCGVHNLHAIPGALGGLAGVVVAAVVPASAYNGDIGAMVRM